MSDEMMHPSPRPLHNGCTSRGTRDKRGIWLSFCISSQAKKFKPGFSTAS